MVALAGAIGLAIMYSVSASQTAALTKQAAADTKQNTDTLAKLENIYQEYDAAMLQTGPAGAATAPTEAVVAKYVTPELIADLPSRSQAANPFTCAQGTSPAGYSATFENRSGSSLSARVSQNGSLGGNYALVQYDMNTGKIIAVDCR